MKMTSKPYKNECIRIPSDLLTEHKAKCTKEGKYVEARLTDDRLQETKAHLKELRQRILERRHDEEVH